MHNLVAFDESTPERSVSGSLLELSVGASPALSCLVYVPLNQDLSRPLFVSVHGISRNRSEHLNAFCREADRYGTVLLLPCFSRQDYHDYQRLGRRGRGPRADLALLEAIDEVGAMLGMDSAMIDIFGFSGGAQFAHRFALAHPNRVAHLGLGSAGWYSWPDEQLPYPLGMGRTKAMPETVFRLRDLLRIPTTLFVGEQDRARDLSLNTTKRIDRVQGLNRRERAINWVKAMRLAGLRHGIQAHVVLELLPEIDHSFERADQHAGLGKRVFRFFYAEDRR